MHPPEMNIDNKKLFRGFGEVKDIKTDILMNEQSIKVKADTIESKVLDLRWFPDLTNEELKIIIQAINPKSDVEKVIKLKLNSTYLWRTGESILKEDD